MPTAHIKYAPHLFADHDHVHCAGCSALVSGPHQYSATGQWQRQCSACGVITRYVLDAPPRPFPAVECGACHADVPNDNRPDGASYHRAGCAHASGPSSPPATYTIEDATRAAVERAARDRAGAFTVYVDRAGIVYVRDSHAAPPPDARVECITQFWSESRAPGGGSVIQIRRPAGESSFVTV